MITINKLVVTLEHDLFLKEVRPTIEAIRQIRGVCGVWPAPHLDSLEKLEEVKKEGERNE